MGHWLPATEIDVPVVRFGAGGDTVFRRVVQPNGGLTEKAQKSGCNDADAAPKAMQNQGGTPIWNRYGHSRHARPAGLENRLTSRLPEEIHG